MSDNSPKNPPYSSQESIPHTKCSALIPDDLLERLREAGYNNRAEAIRLGLECLLKEKESPPESSKIYDKNLEESFKNLQESYKILNESYMNQKISLGILTARNEELNKHLETVKIELEDNKELHKNYMVQVQTVIAQKQIEQKKSWWKFWKKY
jgi:hypothetical protein